MWQKLSIQETRSNKPVIRGWRDDDPYYIMANIWQNSCLQFPGGRSRVYCRSICGEKIEKNQGISVCWLLLNTFVLREKKRKSMSRRKLVILQAEIRKSVWKFWHSIGKVNCFPFPSRGVIWWINNLSKLGREWRTENPGVLQSMGLQRVRQLAEQQQHVMKAIWDNKTHIKTQPHARKSPSINDEVIENGLLFFLKQLDNWRKGRKEGGRGGKRERVRRKRRKNEGRKTGWSSQQT